VNASFHASKSLKFAIRRHSTKKSSRGAISIILSDFSGNWHTRIRRVIRKNPVKRPSPVGGHYFQATKRGSESYQDFQALYLNASL
jgi:hypothetical protein